MRKVTIILSVVVLWALGSSRARAGEYPPTLNGKTYHEWMKELDSSDPKRKKAALGGLYPAGPLVAKAALPATIEGLGSDDPDYVYISLIMLQHLGPEAKEAVPALAKLLREDKKDRWVFEGFHAVEAIGPAAKDCLPTLVATLKHKNPNLQFLAVMAVAALGPEAGDAVPDLLRCVKENQQRPFALYALGRIGKPEKEALSEVEKFAKDPDADVAGCATFALAGITGKMPDGAEESFKKLVLKPYPFEDIGLDGVALGGPKALAFLIECTASKERSKILPSKAARRIAAMGTAGKEAVPALIKQVREGSDYLGNEIEAIRALGAIGQDAKEAVPMLIEKLRSDTVEVQYSAGEALKKINPEAAKKAGVL
jgi:HEAT repeat protein